MNNRKSFPGNAPMAQNVNIEISNRKVIIARSQAVKNLISSVGHHAPMQSEEQQEDSKMASSAVEESHSEEVFSHYKCQSVPKHYNCLKHPGSIVEAGALAAQDLPTATYNLTSIPQELIQDGKLSELQIEGILYACQRHQLVLPDGKRCGFFLADGTGVGKGRQISGIVLDNLCRNRRKHIWFSISSDLRHDAERDLRDIGCYVKVIDGCQQLDQNTKGFGLSSDYKEGVIFSTYSTLVSSTQKDTKKSCRLDQLIEWCGKDFDGCLIFDECHKAKHFIPGKEKKSTKIAVAVTNIQRLLPKARVVYCSATGVTDVKNMAFMERLGLWGIGATFPTFESFLDSLSKRGLGALEMLSMEMKASGMYVSRGLSYHDAEFQTVEAILTTTQNKIYDKAVKIWRELKRCLGIALKRTGNTNVRIWNQYWGCHQRFFKQLCMNMKLPEMVRQAKEALNEGKAVVIGLQTTGEASLDAELDQRNGKISSFLSLTREILRRFILQNFPTTVHLPGEDDKSDEWCTQAKCMLLDITEKVSLPNSPLDDMIDQLGGPSCVAEMTGRKGFIGRYNQQNKPKYILRGCSTSSASSGTESVNVQERNAFMNGEKMIAIISDAASTGISLHADIRSANSNRRVHITAELPWSADKAVQQLGRSHRSNQKSGPIYKLLTSNLGGERRFAAAVAKRLQSLGAITKGDRRAATGADLTQFNFDTMYGRIALKAMYESIHKGQMFVGLPFSKVVANCSDETKQKCSTLENFNQIMKECLVDMDILEHNTLGASVMEKHAKDVGKFLNRILGLEVFKQNLIFSYFCHCLESTTEAAKREGRYNEGVSDLKGNSITIDGLPRIVFKETQLGSSVTRHVKLFVDRGYPFEKATSKLAENTREGGESGFYRSKREQYGKKLYLLAIQKERNNHLFNVTRPNTGMSQFEEERGDLFMKYDKISIQDAEDGWVDQYTSTKESCIHGTKCKHKGSCMIGSRVSDVHLITGRILSILPALELTVARYGHALQLPRELRNLRVVRVELDNGERLIGLRYPHVLISDAEQYLKEQKAIGNSGMVFTPSVTTEAETPVDKKASQKALTKPVTLHTFFGAKSSTSPNLKPIQQNENEEPLKNKLSPSLSMPSISSKDLVTSIKGGNKRPASRSGTPVSKRQRKQGNIFNMFVKKNDEEKKKKKPKYCPVCQNDLSGLSNENVNTHIDGCIIE